ncbi:MULTISPECIES: PKD domain-containing protein [Niastella]|uniref:PKD domain-containing protein n=1 Tax=Niastella soli TaxID=2821487 RepID=A0ABS3YVN0_9BACT|nr:PKD domain-containing protein [Niastella soli]MBO9201460.1 PKD domain-containing protein [Niastella soli]
MRRSLAIALLLFFGTIQSLFAEHIKGGEMFYEYLGPGSDPNFLQYRVTLKLYIDCNANSSGQLDTEIKLTVFDKGNIGQVRGSPFTASYSNDVFLRFDPSSNPCINNPPSDVCYRVRSFSAVIFLPISTNGYIIAYQRCCRINNIVNLQAPSNSVGATYTCEIPGTNVLPDAYKNSSPRFLPNDATAICRGSNFTLSFAAVEPDGTDSIAYMFCNGYSGASSTSPNPSSASPPPYASLNYQGAYNGNAPLGGQVRINSKTGIISGIAPSTIGQYVITVCAYEYRQGRLINIHRKDVHVKVSDCIPLKALLDPNYAFCDDFLVTFKNEQVNPAGSVYTWDFGDGSPPETTSDLEGRLQHQYQSAGSYTVKLKVVLAGQCEDEAVTVANVYPGFFPAFKVQGTCVLLPIQFIDQTTATYGRAAKWTWDFGDETTDADVSSVQNPGWKYNTPGSKTVSLTVESDKGCIATITNIADVRDKPPIDLPFKDTLICSIDTLPLIANGNGIFSWSPLYNILYENTSRPLVWPKRTTTYSVSLNENGCVNTADVRVRVVDFVTLDAGVDSTICLTDTVQLNPQSDGLKFEWTSNNPSYFDNPNVKQPWVRPSSTTIYHVVAHIGKCLAEDDVKLTTIPYPIARAGADTLICYEDTASIHASMVGYRFFWSPISTLSDPDNLNTLAWPRRTTSYVLSVYDTLGCPKPGRDTIVVRVKNEIVAFAGRDTSIVVGQPLQLNGSGSDFYEWQPPLYLNRNDVQNPVALLNDHFSYQLRAYTVEGCYDLDTINIKVFKTAPDIFVPNAFRPGSGRNNVLRPIPVGIARLDYFCVFNRWGQMVYQSYSTEAGWDGTIGGKQQDAGTYVWMARGTDYTGRLITRKGTAVLLR